jgi:hypothetical protein
MSLEYYLNNNVLVSDWRFDDDLDTEEECFNDEVCLSFR